MVYRFISAEKVNGKTVALRVDLNSPVKDGTVVESERLRQHAQTIKSLANKGGKIVVLAHQGQKGEPDFLSLQQHAKILEKLLEKPVRFVSWNQDYLKEIKSAKKGEVILLENTRFHDYEAVEKPHNEHAAADFVQKLSNVVNFFALDALSVAHRGHASVIGFNAIVPPRVGPVLEKEVRALEKLSNIKNGRLLVLGGKKFEDSLKLLKHMLENGMVDKVVVGGLFGELFLKANGANFGAKEDFFEKQGFGKVVEEADGKQKTILDVAKELFNAHRSKIVLPIDLALDENGRRVEIPISALPSDFVSKDIGSKTIESFGKEIANSKVIVFNGPMGVYEEMPFSHGSKGVFNAMAQSKGFSILGGGDTETALDLLKMDKRKFGHVSLSGKALLTYLSGKKLVGLDSLHLPDAKRVSSVNRVLGAKSKKARSTKPQKIQVKKKRFPQISRR